MSPIAKSLPNDTRIDNYVISKTLSRGGFSFVYLAKEVDSGKRVVLKEYMPSKLAKRDAEMRVVARDEETIEYFNHGRKLFLQEAKALAKLQHPNIVHVNNFFSGNGTVYFAMEYEQGHNLHSYIKKHGGFLSEQFLLTVFPDLLNGLAMIHKTGFLHLDIKPSNVHLRPGGSPLLLDFGAVHPIMQTRSSQLTQVITPGFSPIEQYNNNGYVGPWTDIYSLGATMRNCIDRRPPPEAIKRHEHDVMKPATEAYHKKYSANLLKAIDWAMEIDPMLRPQNADELLAVLPRWETDGDKTKEESA